MAAALGEAWERPDMMDGLFLGSFGLCPPALLGEGARLVLEFQDFLCYCSSALSLGPGNLLWMEDPL